MHGLQQDLLGDFSTVSLSGVSDLSGRDGEYTSMSFCIYFGTHPVRAQKVNTKILYCGSQCSCVKTEQISSRIVVLDTSLTSVFCTICKRTEIFFLFKI